MRAKIRGIIDFRVEIAILLLIGKSVDCWNIQYSGGFSGCSDARFLVDWVLWGSAEKNALALPTVLCGLTVWSHTLE